MDEIRSDLSASIQIVLGECIFSCNDVLKAAEKLKLHKADGGKGLSSDYFKKARRGLYVLCACGIFVSRILVYGDIPDDVSVALSFKFLNGRTQMSLTLQ